MKIMVPVRLLKSGKILLEVVGPVEWKFDDVTNHFAIAEAFVTYVAGVYAQVSTTPTRSKKMTAFDNWNTYTEVEIVYDDNQTVRIGRETLLDGIRSQAA
jgi:hypothetical protein